MARTFNGTTDYLEKLSAIASGTPVSFASWFNTTTVSATQANISISNNSSLNYFLLDYINTGGRARVEFSNTSVQVVGATVTVNTWNHLVAVFASTTNRTIYVNNVGVNNTTSESDPVGTNRSNIGILYQGSTTPTLFMNGALAFDAIWNIALSAADVASLFNGASPRRVHPEALLSYARLTGGASPEPDFVSSTTWTLHGTPTESLNPRLFNP